MPQAICHIEKGAIANPKVIRALFDELEDGPWIVRLSKGTKRSTKQNGFYWSVVCPLVMNGLQQIGYSEVKTPDDAHQVLVMLFLKRDIVNLETGEVITSIPGRSSNLSTVEFSEYIEKIAQFCSEYLGIVLPSPTPQFK